MSGKLFLGLLDCCGLDFSRCCVNYTPYPAFSQLEIHMMLRTSAEQFRSPQARPDHYPFPKVPKYHVQPTLILC